MQFILYSFKIACNGKYSNKGCQLFENCSQNKLIDNDHAFESQTKNFLLLHIVIILTMLKELRAFSIIFPISNYFFLKTECQ